MPALTLADLNAGWGAPIPSEPWDLPVSTVRGDGVIKLVDNQETWQVNRLERLSLEFHVPCAGSDTTLPEEFLRVPFPARRQAALSWKAWKPLDLDLAQLRVAHEESFITLHGMFAYFAARHCPSDEEIIQRQWHRFGRAVWDIVENPAYDEAGRVVAMADWGRENLPDEVFDHPWWLGRWDWYPPEPRSVEYIDEENVSEFEFGEGLDGLPVPEGTFPDRPWASWAADAVEPAGVDQRVA